MSLWESFFKPQAPKTGDQVVKYRRLWRTLSLKSHYQTFLWLGVGQRSHHPWLGWGCGLPVPPKDSCDPPYSQTERWGALRGRAQGRMTGSPKHISRGLKKYSRAWIALTRLDLYKGRPLTAMDPPTRCSHITSLHVIPDASPRLFGSSKQQNHELTELLFL